LPVRQRLVAKDEDGVPIHRGVNAAYILVREWRAAVDADDLAGERAGNGSNHKGHGSLLEAAPPIPQKFIAGGPTER
jgi:hypothetical protein